ncbi:GGDEF domain-containing protein [Mycobacterium sp. AMU20-3851]|uniref:GGDEF domain-containing protein n=1 Tax=Mycobacterium sp. AMU20-3851 TaxID=3122055 RepID=UPI00375466FC
MRLFARVTGVCCVGMAALLVIVQFHPAGPTAVPVRVLHMLVAVSAVAVGWRWIRGPWPSYRQAIAFVVWADIALILTAGTLSTAAAQLSTMTYMGIIGGFAGFLLGARVLLVHCVVGGAVIAGITAWAVLAEQHSVFELFVHFMPALVWVVAVPLVGSVLIDIGRRAIVRTARSAHSDSLTGLRNRRGIQASVGRALARGPRTTVAMAVCDIDRFKSLNDADGHAAGDAALVALAARLQEVTRPEEFTARIGGDELVLVSLLDDEAALADLAERVRALTRVQVGDVELTVSIGIAAMSSTEPHFTLDAVVRHADAAMYEAKRAGGAMCVGYPTESTTAASADRRRAPDRPA